MNTHKNIFNKPGRKKKKKGPSLAPQSIFGTKSIEPKEKGEIVFYDEGVKFSKRLNEREFLNHLGPKNLTESKDTILKFKDNLQDLHHYFDFDTDETSIDGRLKEIFSLYVKEDDLENLDKNVCKARIKTAVGQSTGFRIFLYLDSAENKYKIFLLDPLHLVIPSRVQRAEKTYENNKGNGMCFNRFFN